LVSNLKNKKCLEFFKSVLKEKTSWSLITSFWRKNYPEISKISEHIQARSPKSMENLTPEKFVCPVLNLLDNFSLQMMFLNSKMTFQSLIRIFLGNGLERFQMFLILQI
jgi:hypothetical protein